MTISPTPRRLANPGRAVATLVLLACAGRVSTRDIATNPVVTPSHSDTVAVYQRALETLYESTSERPAMIVLYDSATTGVEKYCPKWPCKLSPAVDSHVEASALKNYARALSQRGPLQRDLRGAIPIEFASTAELVALPSLGASRPNAIERHGQSPDPVWDQFRTRFPGAWGLTSVTRIAFSDDADQALLQIRHGCGARCVRTESMFFEKRGGTWFIESRFPEEAEDWIGQGDLRYVGPDAKSRALYFRELDAAAMAAADSVRKDQSPRHIRGTVINRAFGTPIAGAQIFVRSPQTEPKPWARVVSDSLGHFAVNDAPIGTIMLELQCPGPAHRPGTTLDAPGFYLFPAMDTTLTLGPPDLRPCWNRARIHRLSSGQLTSGENFKSQFPAEREAGVLSAVLRQVVSSRMLSGQAIFSARTYARCSKYEPCSTLRLPQLTMAGVLDSTATVDFRLHSQEVLPISTAFAKEEGMQLLTDAERAYLGEEGYWLALDVVPTDGGPAFWKALASARHGASEVISFTRPGFNPAGTQAMVELRIETQGDDTRNTILLKRGKRGWRIAREHLENETLSGKLTPASGKVDGGKCVPSRPGKPPTRERLSKVRGDYEFEMISSVGGGPGVQWRMRFFPDTSSWARAQPDKAWTEAQRQKFEQARKFRLPVFVVLDPATGNRMRSVEAGTYFKSGENYFANADHMLQFDGFGYDFEVYGISETGIFGSWEHYSFGVRIDSKGNPLPEPSGHFCARSVPAPASP
jgi:hypothetical protein